MKNQQRLNFFWERNKKLTRNNLRLLASSSARLQETRLDLVVPAGQDVYLSHGKRFLSYTTPYPLQPGNAKEPCLR